MGERLASCAADGILHNKRGSSKSQIELIFPLSVRYPLVRVNTQLR